MRREDVVGKPSQILRADPDDPDLYASAFREVHETGSWHGEIWNRRKNGELYTALVTVTAVKSDSGRITHFVSTLTDITALKDAHSRLQEMNQRLEERTLQAEEANRAKGQFLANMSHEIRTPMNGILGVAELLAGTDLTPEQRDYVGMINRSGDGLLSILNDILDVSKMEAGQLTLEAVPFHLELLVYDTAELFRSRVEGRPIELLVDFDPACPVHLVGDPGRLRQVLNNLVANAVKFTERGHILIGVRSLPPLRGEGSMPPHRAGHRHRRAAGKAGAAVQSLHAGGCLHSPALRRHGPGLDHREAPRGSHGRHRAHGEPGGRRHDVRRGSEAAAGCRQPRTPAGARGPERPAGCSWWTTCRSTCACSAAS